MRMYKWNLDVNGRKSELNPQMWFARNSCSITKGISGRGMPCEFHEAEKSYAHFENPRVGSVMASSS